MVAELVKILEGCHSFEHLPERLVSITTESIATIVIVEGQTCLSQPGAASMLQA